MRAIRNRALALVLLTLMAGACDQRGTPTSADVITKGPAVRVQGSTYEDGSAIELVTLERTDTVTYVFSNVFNKGGGRLEMGSHALVVPPGALNQRTRFVATITLGQHATLDLKAYSASTGEEITQFGQDVYLALDYEALSWMGDPERLTVVYLVEGTVTGRKEKVASAVSPKTKKVVGRLKHFSVYTMGIE